MNPAVNILLVDDEVRNLETLESVLQAPEYTLVRALTAEKALMLLLDGDFAAIVLDIQMPDMSGIELAHLIKQRKRTQHIPIIFLTAYFQEDKDVLEGYGIGAVDYLTKPINPQILKSKISVFVDLYRKTRALADTNTMLKLEIAQRQHAEEALHKANLELRETIAQLETFSYSVSHDLRAPLRAMQGYSELLLETVASQLDPSSVGYLHRISASAARMDTLIGEVLTYARLLRSEIQLMPIDLDDLVRQIVDTYPLKTNGAEINIHGKLPCVLASEASLTQCVSNLLANAVKFVAPGIKARVQVRAEPEVKHHRLWIEDNGIGIAPEDHERIWGIFTRIGRAVDYDGNGIGLAIVRKGVERMNGRVGLESAVGQGSRFWLSLPKA